MKIVIANDYVKVKTHGEIIIYSGNLPSVSEIINEFADEKRIKVVFRKRAE